VPWNSSLVALENAVVDVVVIVVVATPRGYYALARAFHFIENFNYTNSADASNATLKGRKKNGELARSSDDSTRDIFKGGGPPSACADLRHTHWRNFFDRAIEAIVKASMFHSRLNQTSRRSRVKAREVFFVFRSAKWSEIHQSYARIPQWTSRGA